MGVSHLTELHEAAPAKINLALHVTGRRADGYHDLESLVVFAGLSDELRASRASSDRLVLKGPFASALTSGQSNLVLKAISAFRNRWPDGVDHGVAIELTKNLPIASGIGGGSADAAAALRLMVQFSREPVDPAMLNEVARELGADVPVCLLSQPCLFSGIGEVIKPLGHFPTCYIVLVNPLIPLRTADIFRLLESRSNPGLPEFEDPMAHAAMLALWMEDTRNDLEPPAIKIVPMIGEITTRLRQTRGCISSRMSGSGATVFGLYGTSAQAYQAAQDMRKIWPDFWVAAAPVGLPG